MSLLLRRILFVLMIVLVAACGRSSAPPTAMPAATPAPTSMPDNNPSIDTVSIDQQELGRYESLEMLVSLSAEYENPFDAREVQLNATFTAPDGSTVTAPGFWDGKQGWMMRFTPSAEGEWRYAMVVQDGNGSSDSATGSFTVTPSNLHGWIIPGDQFDPDFSKRYLVYHDGTPFYGIGHCEPMNILKSGFSMEEGLQLFDHMNDVSENYVVWWPLWSSSIISRDYDKYTQSNLDMIDLIVDDAQKEGIHIVFTIWQHNELRDNTHSWSSARWGQNGFKKLTSVTDFFVDDEAWAWQENYYRYNIARWGHSPAIGMWQTITEIDGTMAYGQTDTWHERLNRYFQKNDPYRHPTTASKSGDIDWIEGYLETDMPQVHIYDFSEGAVQAASTTATWTERMWDHAESPNWVGEFGVIESDQYPELFHNSIWAALGAGAAMTPAEWNDGSRWGQMTPEMDKVMTHMSQFIADVPLAAWDPERLTLESSKSTVRAWGVAGVQGGLFWVQDYSMEGVSTTQIRDAELSNNDVTITATGLSEGTYTVHPYDTWQGNFLESFEVTCQNEGACSISLPPFSADMAFKLERN